MHLKEKGAFNGLLKRLLCLDLRKEEQEEQMYKNNEKNKTSEENKENNSYINLE